MEYPQIYPFTIAEAKAKEETALFRESHKLNTACKKAVEKAIRENFDGFHLKKECIKPVIEEYGIDRVDWVLANTIQMKPFDGRFSRDNKAWAKIFPIPGSGDSVFDQRLDYVVQSHPAVLDIFINLVRWERDKEKALPEGEKSKPSIRAQLSTPPTAGEKPQAKGKDREVR